MSAARTPIERRWRSAGVYSVATTVQRAIGFAMLPVYTRAISTEQYGSLGVLVSVSTAVQILFSVALDTYIVRSYFQMAHEPERRDRTLQSLWRLLLAYPVIASLVAGAILWALIGEGTLIGGSDLFLALLSAALNTAGSTLPLAVMRARQQLRGFIAVSAAVGVLTPVLTIFFVVVLEQGVRGWFLAACVANTVALAIGMKMIPWMRHVPFDKHAVRAGVLFSLPLVPHLISTWALQLADRSVLAGLVATSELGVYTLAGNMAALALVLMIAVNQAFAPTYARAGVGTGIGSELRRTVVAQVRIVVMIGLTTALLGPPAVSILSPSAYHGASDLVPWIALGYVFLGFYFIPMNGATLAAGRRKFAWVATAFSAATNIGLVYCLTPAYGLEGAAAASSLGYLVLLLTIAAWARSDDNPVTYDWPRILPVIGLAALMYAAAANTRPSNDLAGAALACIWLLSFAAVLVAPDIKRRASGQGGKGVARR